MIMQYKNMLIEFSFYIYSKKTKRPCNKKDNIQIDAFFIQFLAPPGLIVCSSYIQNIESLSNLLVSLKLPIFWMYDKQMIRSR